MDNIERVVSFLEKYAGHPYSSPLKVPDEKTKKAMLQIFDEQKNVQIAFDDFIDEVGKSSNLIAIIHKGFLDGSRRKVKKYYWCEFRTITSINRPESISLFIESVSSGIQFRVSTEINESKCSKQELAYHNSIVDMTLPIGMYYSLNNKNIKDILYTDSQSKAKSLLKSTYSKIQISKIIPYSSQNVESMTKECSSAINELFPIYLKLTKH